MRVLVTGGAGFIGSHLCEVLVRAGHDVMCMDNLSTSRRRNVEHMVGHSRFELWRHDVCDPWHVECDRIYHLACPASPVQYRRNPVRTIKTATLGTLNALECARNVGARILLASTSEVYGDPEIHPQSEEYWGHVNPVGTRSCYDEGKRVGESIAVSWARQYGTSVRIARIFNTYGPRMASDDGRMIPNFVLQALAGDPVTVYGDGSQTRSWCYVSDTVRGLVRLMEADPGDPPDPFVVNIGNPEERSVLDTAQDVIRIAGSSSEIVLRELPEDDPCRRRPDVSRAASVLGWSPEVGYEAGIARTVDWFRHRPFEGALPEP